MAPAGVRYPAPPIATPAAADVRRLRSRRDRRWCACRRYRRTTRGAGWLGSIEGVHAPSPKVLWWGLWPEGPPDSREVRVESSGRSVSQMCRQCGQKQLCVCARTQVTMAFGRW